jgi:hypothetical protein
MAFSTLNSVAANAYLDVIRSRILIQSLISSCHFFAAFLCVKAVSGIAYMLKEDIHYVTAERNEVTHIFQLIKSRK